MDLNAFVAHRIERLVGVEDDRVAKLDRASHQEQRVRKVEHTARELDRSGAGQFRTGSEIETAVESQLSARRDVDRGRRRATAKPELALFQNDAAGVL